MIDVCADVPENIPDVIELAANEQATFERGAFRQIVL
jgi:hypothetical protein